MTTGKEWKLILLFTLPIMAGNLLQQLYQTVDGIIVGNFVSEPAFAAVGASQPLAFMFLALAFGMSVGVGVVISQYYGAGKHDKLPLAIDTSIILLGVCGLALTLLGLIFSPFMLRVILGVPDEDGILPLAVTYMRIYSIGLFFQFLYNGIAAILRGFGDSKATLYFLIVATVLNTLLDLLFVIVFGWGVAGAAVATVIAQIVCVTVSYVYLRKKHPFINSAKHFDSEIAVTTVRLGLPIAIQMAIVSFGNGAMHRLVNGFNATAPGVIAAYSAGNRIDAFLFVPIMGFQAGLANFAGQNIGAGNLQRVRRGYFATLVMSLSLTIAMSVALYVYAAPVVTAFGLTDSALLIGVEQIKFMTMFFWMFSVHITLGGVLQGAGDTVFMSASTLTALAARVSTGYLAVELGILGYSAAWVTTPVAWFLAMVITYTRYLTGGWKKKAVAGKLAKTVRD